MQILVVDDEKISKRTVTARLKKFGYKVLEACDGNEALEIMKNEQINIVILDWMMPGMNGIDFCRRVKEKKSYYVYIIMLTSKTDENDRLVGFEAGVDQYLTKPPDFEELGAIVRAGARVIQFEKREAGIPSPDQRPAIEKAHGDNAHTDASRIVKPKEASGVEIEQVRKIKAKKNSNSELVERETWHNYFIVKIALTSELVTKKQLAFALSFQKKAKALGQNISLEKIFYKRKWLSLAKMKDLQNAAKRRLGKRFGSLVVESGLVTQEQVDSALLEQAEEYKNNGSCRPIGEILVDQDILTETQCDQIWREQQKPTTESTDNQAIDKSAVESEKDRHIEEKSNADVPDIEHMVKLNISDDKFEAAICISGSAKQEIGLDSVKEYLKKYDIVYGIVSDELIIEFLKQERDEIETFIIAQGKPPIEGRGTTIKYCFDTEYLKSGKIFDENGKIDFKDRGEIPHVKEGDLVAEKIPHEPGQQGIDIHGCPVPAKDVEVLDIRCESNVELSEDGLNAFAQINGKPHITISGKISVLSELNIKGDVDYNTGNINFAGDVKVNGIIQSGFSVQCCNLTALAVNDAIVDVTGDVNIKNGITDAKIKAEGSVTAKYIKNSNIRAFGSVFVEKEVYYCKIRISGEFKSERGNIISSFVAAKQGITTKNIGTDVSPPCKICVGLDENIKKNIKGFDNALKENEKILKEAQAEYDDLKKSSDDIEMKIADLAQAQDRAASKKQSIKQAIEVSGKKGEISNEKFTELKKVIGEINLKISNSENELENHFKQQDNLTTILAGARERLDSATKDSDNINEEKDAIKKWSKKITALSSVKVFGTLFSGTTIKGRHSSIAVEETVKNMTIKETKTSDTEYKMDIVR